MATVLASGRRNGNGSRIGAIVSPSVVRCAVYCRQSVSEGTAESASIAVQREACQNYVAAHRAEGWVAIPDVYADQGISGATLQRPAMQRLLADISADRIDAIIVYKLDRVSRNLADFAGLVQSLDARGVRLVSVTQSFDTKSAIGRLTLGILMSFSEFERTLVSERTKDAIVAARKKGKWTGGCPPWGYDVAGGKLVVNEVEAHRVREAFRLYLDCGSLIDTAAALNARDWPTKVTATRNGGSRGGKPWNKGNLHGVLTSPLYAGRIIAGGEAVAGEHEAIVPIEVWDAVQARLESNGGDHTRGDRHDSGALLKGILRCELCGSAMTPTHCRKGPRRYSFYACSRRVKGGKAACAAPYVSAPKVEAQYVAEIARRATDPKIVAAVVAATREQLAEKKRSLSDEARSLHRALKDAERHGLDARIRELRAWAVTLERERDAVDAVRVDSGDVARMLAEDFEKVWGAMTTRERRRVVEIIVEPIRVRCAEC